jgi:hypothetical protein
MLKFPIVERQEMNLVFKIKVFLLSPKFGILINPFISIFQNFGLLHEASETAQQRIPRSRVLLFF